MEEAWKEGWKNGKDVHRNRLYLTFKPIVSSISFILYFFTLKNSGSCYLSFSPSFSLFLLLAQEPIVYLMLSYFTYFPKIVFFLHILYQIVKLKKSITIPFFFSFVNTLLWLNSKFQEKLFNIKRIFTWSSSDLKEQLMNIKCKKSSHQRDQNLCCDIGFNISLNKIKHSYNYCTYIIHNTRTGKNRNQWGSRVLNNYLRSACRLLVILYTKWDPLLFSSLLSTSLPFNYFLRMLGYRRKGDESSRDSWSSSRHYIEHYLWVSPLFLFFSSLSTFPFLLITLLSNPPVLLNTIPEANSLSSDLFSFFDRKS